MKKFSYEDKASQLNEMLCYAHSYELEQGDIREIEEFLLALHKHFPRTIHANGRETPFEEDNFSTQQWRAAIAHVNRIIESRKAENRHRWVLGVSMATLLILILTLAYSIWTGERKDTTGENPGAKTESKTSVSNVKK